MKRFFHILEYISLRLLLTLLKSVPLKHASNIMGYIMRHMGPMLPISSIGKMNLRLAFPSYTPQQHQDILLNCWENIGRNIAELPHIPAFFSQTSTPNWEIRGQKWLNEAKLSQRPLIFFSGHLGNWEIMPAILAHYGLPVASFYRKPNNPYVNLLLKKYRHKNINRTDIPLFSKGAKGARLAVHYLAQGGNIGLLGDQKMNDGICTTFFNRPTMTAPATAVLALKFKALIVTGYVSRESSGRLILNVFPPLDPLHDNFSLHPRHLAVERITQTLNDRLQEWITQQPGSWLWFHRRWSKKLYQ